MQKYRPCRKVDQGQPQIMININHDGQETPLLQTMFR